MEGLGLGYVAGVEGSQGQRPMLGAHGFNLRALEP